MLQDRWKWQRILLNGKTILLGESTDLVGSPASKTLDGIETDMLLEHVEDDFGFAFCLGFFTFFTESHFKHHVFTLLLFFLLYRMDAILDALDEGVIAELPAHVIEESTSGFWKSPAVSLRSDEDEFGFVREDERWIIRADAWKSVDGSASVENVLLQMLLASITFLNM